MESEYPIYKNVTASLQLKGQKVKVHALCTGMVAVKTAFRAKKGAGPLAKINILLDGTYTEFMPIWAWIIEHPEGIIAIDTGEVAQANDATIHLANESAYSRYLARHTSNFMVRKEDELNVQLSGVGLSPKNIALVVLTHLHLDHTDGVKFFPDTEIIVNRFEYDHPYSNLPTTYPGWFRPHLVDYKKDRVEVFGNAYPITRDEDLLYVPTPGHTSGHSGVIFRTDEVDILFGGDSSFHQDQLLKKEIGGVNKDFSATRETHKKILTYASVRPTIYLPSHDPEAGVRLLNKSLLNPIPKG